jgi:hypothetical protein
MDNKERTPVKYIVVFFIVTSLVIVGIIALFYNVNRGATEPATTSHIDPDSGETVYKTDGKSPEVYGINPDTPLFLGFSSLYDIGLPQVKIEFIKSGLASYADSIKKEQKITQISLRKDATVTSNDSETGVATYDFTIVMNGEAVYNLHATSDDITTIDFTLSKDGKLVYTSPKA